jgi:hypothetical protein
MRKLTLIPILIFLLAGIQTLVTDSEAYARHRLWHCCSCGMCDSSCWCKGQTIYCTCVVPESDDLSSISDFRSMSQSRAFNIANASIDERIRTIMLIDRRNLTLRILDGYQTNFKTWCPNTHEDTPGDNTVALETHDHTH